MNGHLDGRDPIGVGMRLGRRSAMALMVTLGLAGGAAGTADAAETIRIAEQFGVSYLPLHMIREHGLLEKHGQEQGIELTGEWIRFSSGAVMNDAIISGSLDVASGGIGPLLTLWDKTKGNLDVKAIAAMNDMPLFLTTRNPDIESLADFTEADKIALPAVKVSIQARTLQMAAEQQLGDFEALDARTVSMSHPDALLALLSGQGEITGHFTSPPFQYQELEDPNVRLVLSSYDVLGGKSTFNVVWSTAKFRSDRPEVYEAFRGAFAEAMELIAADPAAAAEVYVRQENSKLSPEFILKIIEDPDTGYTLEPHNTIKYAEFMHKVGAIGNKPESWKDYFFEEAHDLDGS
jgi:NitT/TauT family transport system substrate-binding protein